MEPVDTWQVVKEARVIMSKQVYGEPWSLVAAVGWDQIREQVGNTLRGSVRDEVWEYVNEER